MALLWMAGKISLGVWIGEHESSKFWLNVLNDLKSRGVMDVYLFCTDGLCGMMEAIRAAYPQSRLQRCIVHQICSSTRFVSWKDTKQVAADLKKIYTSSSARSRKTSPVLPTMIPCAGCYTWPLSASQSAGVPAARTGIWSSASWRSCLLTALPADPWL